MSPGPSTATAQSRDALAALEAALELRPDDANARFAAALAQAIGAVELAGMLTSLPGQLNMKSASRNRALAALLHGVLIDLRDELAAALDRMDDIDPDAVDFEVEAAWVYLSTEPFLVYRGVFDGGDLHLMRATLSFVVALADIFAGQNMETDLLGVANRVKGDGFDTDFAGLGRLLADLLRAEGGRFFEADSETGEALFADSQARLAAVGRELNLAVEWMRAHGDDGRPQVSVLEDQGEGRYQLVVRNAVERDPDLPPGRDLEERPFRTDLDDALLEKFAHASMAITTPGEAVDFRAEVLPILATILHAGFQTGVLNDLLGGLPINLGGLDRGALERSLQELMPLPVALDPGTFFAGPPRGIRVILPDPAPDDPPRFLAEWECPGDLDEAGLPSDAGGFLCANDAELIDGQHFDGALAADGLAARTPYFRFADPTLGGLVLVDVSELGVPGWEAPGWAPPDELALNAALSVGLERLFALLGAALGP